MIPSFRSSIRELLRPVLADPELERSSEPFHMMVSILLILLDMLGVSGSYGVKTWLILKSLRPQNKRFTP